MRYINCLTITKVVGFCLENAVFIHLSMKGINPTGYLILGKKNEVEGEIDFDYKIGEKQYLVQVTHTINGKDYKREIENLRNLPSLATKCVVYLTNVIEKEEKGIVYIQALDFFKS